jgi:hypothetical protein
MLIELCKLINEDRLASAVDAGTGPEQGQTSWLATAVAMALPT